MNAWTPNSELLMDERGPQTAGMRARHGKCLSTDGGQSSGPALGLIRVGGKAGGGQGEGCGLKKGKWGEKGAMGDAEGERTRKQQVKEH